MASDSCYYKLNLSNTRLEDSTDMNEKSTAGNMTITLDQELDLNNTIYMKSLSAEIALDEFTVSNLPNSFSQHENMELKLIIPKTLSHGNAVLDEDYLQTANNTPCLIPMTDCITSEPQKAIDHVNDRLHSYTNRFIVFRYLECMLDTNCFKDEVFKSTGFLAKRLTPKDKTLIHWHIKVATLCRQQYVATLNSLLKITQDVEKTKTSSPKSLTSKDIDDLIGESTIFRTVAERTSVNKKVINFEDFHGVDINKAETLLPVLAKVDTDILAFLRESGAITEINAKLTQESFDLLSAMRENNLALLHQAEIIHNILTIEQRKETSKFPMHTFYHTEIVSLFLDPTNKCRFALKPNLFLANDNSSLTINMGQLTSRTLGAELKEGTGITIGPLSYKKSVTKGNRTILKQNIIETENDRLYSKVSPVPHTIFIISDSLANDCKLASAWSKDTKFPTYHTLAAYTLTDSDLKIGCIRRLNHVKNFQRIKQAQNIMRYFNLAIVDQSFRQLDFPRQTYCKFSLCIRAANMNI